MKHGVAEFSDGVSMLVWDKYETKAQVRQAVCMHPDGGCFVIMTGENFGFHGLVYYSHCKPMTTLQTPPCSPGCYHHETHPCEVCGRLHGFPAKATKKQRIKSLRCVIKKQNEELADREMTITLLMAYTGNSWKPNTEGFRTGFRGHDMKWWMDAAIDKERKDKLG